MSLLHRSKGSASARAQLTTFHDGIVESSGDIHGSGSRSTSLQTTFQMLVSPEDGQPEFKSSMSVWGSVSDRLQPGRWTYVSYDPDDPDRCHLDKDRLAKEFEPLYDGKARVMIPKEISDAWFKAP